MSVTDGPEKAICYFPGLELGPVATGETEGSEMARSEKLDLILSYLNTIFARLELMSAQLDALTARVAANNDVVQSAITLLRGLKEQLDAAGTDAAALQELSDSLGAQTDQLAEAVASNTPAEGGGQPGGTTGTGTT